MLTPDEIMARDFLVSLRGYDREEVEGFLAEVAHDVRVMRERIEELEAELAAAGEVPGGAATPERFDKATAFRLLGEETTRILVAAEDSATEIRDKAEREAQERVDDARRTARSELEDARRTAARVVAEAEHVRDRVLTEVEDVETARDQLLEELHAAIGTVQEAVTDLEDTDVEETVEEIPPPPRPETVDEPAATEPASVPPSPPAAATESAPEPESAPAAEPEPGSEPVSDAGLAPEPEAVSDAGLAAEPEPVAEPEVSDAGLAAEPEAVAEPEVSEAAPETAADAAVEPEAEPVPEPGEEPTPEAAPETATTGDSPTTSAPAGAEAGGTAAPPTADAAGTVTADAPETATTDEAATGAAAAETAVAPEAAATTPAGDTAAEPPGGGVAVDVDPMQLREQTLATVRPGMLRRVKRTLQDVQNEVLTAIREAGADADVEDLLPDEDDFEQLDAVGDMFLTAAFRGGVGDGASLADGELDDEVGDGEVVSEQRSSFRGQLEHEVAAGLRATLRAGLQAAESEPQLSERVGEVFRDLKGPVVEGLVDRSLVATYGHGLLAAWRQLDVEASDWVLADESRCPEGRCRANASEGPVALGGEFPSGDAVPPAHPGCTCGLAPAS